MQLFCHSFGDILIILLHSLRLPHLSSLCDPLFQRFFVTRLSSLFCFSQFFLFHRFIVTYYRPKHLHCSKNFSLVSILILDSWIKKNLYNSSTLCVDVCACVCFSLNFALTIISEWERNIHVHQKFRIQKCNIEFHVNVGHNRICLSFLVSSWMSAKMTEKFLILSMKGCP